LLLFQCKKVRKPRKNPLLSRKERRAGAKKLLLETAEKYSTLEQQENPEQFADEFAQPSSQYRVPMAMIDDAKQMNAENKRKH
jgi:hypothetical protein